jgi:hypothetical protein
VSKTVVIRQPDLLPHLALFHRLLSADIFVVLDNVQFVHHTSRSWTHRDKIKTTAGERWITVSVKKAPVSTRIDQIEVSRNVDWRSANLNAIRNSYAAAPHFAEVFPRIVELYEFDGTLLADFTWKSIALLCDLFDIHVESIRASVLDVSGSSNELLSDIVTRVGGNRYLSGVGAKGYFDSRPFEEAGIEVVWQEFVHPTYPQLHGAFIPDLSSIDLLFNCGISESRRILRNG